MLIFAIYDVFIIHFHSRTILVPSDQWTCALSEELYSFFSTLSLQDSPIVLQSSFLQPLDSSKTLKIRCSTPKDLTIFQDSFFENNPQYCEHYTIQPHFSDSQYSYLTIKDINMNHTKKIVNLYGIIVSASRPLKNNRNEYNVKYRILDPFSEGQIFLVSQYYTSLNSIPLAHNVGDIIRFHRVQIIKFKNSLMGSGNQRSSVLLYDIHRHSFSQSSKQFTFTSVDQEIITYYSAWMRSTFSKQDFIIPYLKHYVVSPNCSQLTTAGHIDAVAKIKSINTDNNMRASMVCTVPQGFGNSEDINVFIENEFYDYFQSFSFQKNEWILLQNVNSKGNDYTLWAYTDLLRVKDFHYCIQKIFSYTQTPTISTHLLLTDPSFSSCITTAYQLIHLDDVDHIYHLFGQFLSYHPLLSNQLYYYDDESNTTQISCFFLFTDGTGILPVFLFDHSFHQLTKNEYRSLSNENPNTTNQVLHSIFSKLTQPNAYVDFAVRGYRVSNQILYCLQDTEISF